MSIETIDGIGVRFRVGKLTKDGEVVWDIDKAHNFITEAGFEMLNTLPCVNVTEYVHLGDGTTPFVVEGECTITESNGVYTLETPDIDLTGYAGKKVIVKHNTNFTIDTVTATHTATLTPVDYINMVTYPYTGGCIIVLDDSNALGNKLFTSNSYVPGEGTSRNLKYVDTTEKVVYIENTRTVVFPTITAAQQDITEIGWSPTEDGPLFGCKNIDITYYKDESPYIQVSIVRKISYDTVISTSPFNSTNTIEHALPYDSEEFNISDCSWIREDGTSAPPKMDSFAEINIYDTDRRLDQYIDVMLTNNEVSDVEGRLEVLDRTLIKSEQNTIAPELVPSTNNRDSRNKIRHHLGDNWFIRGVDLLNSTTFNGQFPVRDSIATDLGDLIEPQYADHKKIYLLPYNYSTPLVTTRGEVSDVYIAYIQYTSGFAMKPLYKDTFEPITLEDGSDIYFSMPRVYKRYTGTVSTLAIHTRLLNFAIDTSAGKVWAIVHEEDTNTIKALLLYYINATDRTSDSRPVELTSDKTFVIHHLTDAEKAELHQTHDDGSSVYYTRIGFTIDNDIVYRLEPGDPTRPVYKGYNVAARHVTAEDGDWVTVYKNVYEADYAFLLVKNKLDLYTQTDLGVYGTIVFTVCNNVLLVVSSTTVWSYIMFDEGVNPLNIKNPRVYQAQPHVDSEQLESLVPTNTNWRTYITVHDEEGNNLALRFPHTTNIQVDSVSKAIVISGTGFKDLNPDSFTTADDNVYAVVLKRDNKQVDALCLEAVDTSADGECYRLMDTWIPSLYVPHGLTDVFDNTYQRATILDVVVDDQSHTVLLDIYSGSNNYMLATLSFGKDLSDILNMNDPYRHKGIQGAVLRQRTYTIPVQRSAMSILATANASIDAACIVLSKVDSKANFVVPHFTDNYNDVLKGMDIEIVKSDRVFIKKLTNNMFVFTMDQYPNRLYYIQYNTSSYVITNQGYVELDNVVDHLNLDIVVLHRIRSLVYFAVSSNSILTFRYDVNQSEPPILVYSTNAIKDIGTADISEEGTVVSNTAFRAMKFGYMASTTGAIARVCGINDQRQMMLTTFHDDIGLADVAMFDQKNSDGGVDQYLVTQSVQGETSLYKLHLENQIIANASMTTKKIAYSYKGIVGALRQVSDELFVGFSDVDTIATYKASPLGLIQIDTLNVNPDPEGASPTMPLIVDYSEDVNLLHVSASPMSDSGFCLVSYNKAADNRIVCLQIGGAGDILNKNQTVSQITSLTSTTNSIVSAINCISDVDFVLCAFTTVVHMRVTVSTQALTVIDTAMVQAPAGISISQCAMSRYTNTTVTNNIIIEFYGKGVVPTDAVFTAMLIIDNTASSDTISQNNANAISNAIGIIPLASKTFLIEAVNTTVQPAKHYYVRLHDNVVEETLYVNIQTEEIAPLPADRNKYIKDPVTNDTYVLAEEGNSYSLYRVANNIKPAKLLNFNTLGLEKLRPLALVTIAGATYVYVESITGNYGYYYKLNITSNHLKALNFFTEIGKSNLTQVKNIYAKTYATGDSTPIWIGTIQTGGDSVSIENDYRIELSSVWSRDIT